MKKTFLMMAAIFLLASTLFGNPLGGKDFFIGVYPEPKAGEIELYAAPGDWFHGQGQEHLDWMVVDDKYATSGTRTLKTLKRNFRFNNITVFTFCGGQHVYDNCLFYNEFSTSEQYPPAHVDLIKAHLNWLGWQGSHATVMDTSNFFFEEVGIRPGVPHQPNNPGGGAIGNPNFDHLDDFGDILKPYGLTDKDRVFIGINTVGGANAQGEFVCLNPLDPEDCLLANSYYAFQIDSFAQMLKPVIGQATLFLWVDASWAGVWEQIFRNAGIPNIVVYMACAEGEVLQPADNEGDPWENYCGYGHWEDVACSGRNGTGHKFTGQWIGNQVDGVYNTRPFTRDGWVIVDEWLRGTIYTNSSGYLNTPSFFALGNGNTFLNTRIYRSPGPYVRVNVTFGVRPSTQCDDSNLPAGYTWFQCNLTGGAGRSVVGYVETPPGVYPTQEPVSLMEYEPETELTYVALPCVVGRIIQEQARRYRVRLSNGDWAEVNPVLYPDSTTTSIKAWLPTGENIYGIIGNAILFDEPFSLPVASPAVGGESGSIDQIAGCSTGESIITGVVPLDWALSSYPNPFNPTTNIQYDVLEAGHVTLKVFDLLGREVAKLVDHDRQPGSYLITWNATSFPAGIYFCRIEAEQFIQTRKLVLLK